MARNVGYVFGAERDLDRALETSRRVLGVNQTGGNPARPIYTNLFARITEIVADTDNKEAKAEEVVYDLASHDFIDPAVPWIFDSDLIGDDHTEGNVFSGEDLSEGDIGQLLFYPDESGEGFYYFVKPAAEAAGLSYVQITDVDYTQDNQIAPSLSFVYRGVAIDSLTDGIVVDPPEEDKMDILINGGYPWNLKVGDNLTVFDTVSDILICNNDLEPEPIIKIVNGSPEVWDDETGVSLTGVRPSFRIMSNPSLAALAAYNDTFPIAQWSKRSDTVRIYLPVI